VLLLILNNIVLLVLVKTLGTDLIFLLQKPMLSKLTVGMLLVKVQ